MQRCVAPLVFFAVLAASVLPATAERKANLFPSLKRRRHKAGAIALRQEKVKAHAAQPSALATPVTLAQHAASDEQELDTNFPELPTVSAIMGGAAETMKSINSQASVLQARLAQKQMENEAKMARQKSMFEQKLKQQEKDSRAVAKVNANISSTIAALKKSNAVLRAQSTDLQTGNRIMRNELKLLQSRVGSVQEFLSSSLVSTNDANAKELTVLAPAAGQQKGAATKHSLAVKSKDLDNDDSDDADDKSDEDGGDDGDESGASPSFLGLRSTVHASADMAESELESEIDGVEQAHQNPKDILDVLTSGVHKLEQEEQESEGKLKAMFLSAFKTGVKHRATLMQEQKSLIATRDSLFALESQLKGAVTRLQSTKDQLEQRLKGLGEFMQTLAHFALAPLGSDTQQTMRDVPSKVTFQAPVTADSATTDTPELA